MMRLHVCLRFGILWLFLRTKEVLSPQAYAACIKEAYSDKYNVEVKDIWVIPDYDALVEPYMDEKFGRYCKEEWTQLQWKFEAVAVSVYFPLGVKTMYRRYTADEVIIIRKIAEDKVGIHLIYVSMHF